MKQIKKRYITLIEIMVVITLIALVAGALALNVYGSLEEGRALKTRSGIERIEAILNLRLAEDPGALSNVSDWKKIVEQSPLVKDPSQLATDGWGGSYEVTVNDGTVKVTSAKLASYEAKKKGTK